MYNTLLNNIVNNASEPLYRKIQINKKRLLETVFLTSDTKNVLNMVGFITVDNAEFHNKLEIPDLKMIQVDLNLAHSEVLRKLEKN